MASEPFLRKCRNGYAKLLRLYPKAHRDRFAESMQQTFDDLCRERIKAEKGVFSFALWIFVETFAAIVKENVTNIIRSFMQPPASFKIVKYSAIAVSALMVTGIVTLMIISRGKGEDITGIVAPALLITIVSGIVAIVAAFLQKRSCKRH